MRQRMFNLFGSIRTSMMVAYSIVIGVALLIFLFVSLRYTEKAVLNNSISYSTQIIDLINYDIDSYIVYMENIAALICNNEDVQEYLFDEDHGKRENELLYNKIVTQFKTITETREDIVNIAVIAKDGKSIVNDGKETLNPYVNQLEIDWVEEAMKQSDVTVVSDSHVQNMIRNKYSWVVTLSRSFKHSQTNESTALFFIDLNYRTISDLCDNNSFGEKGYVYIVDANGNIIYHPKQQLLFSGLKTEQIERVLSANESHFVTEEGENSRLYTISKSPKTGWTTVGVSYMSELMKDRKEAKLINYLTAGILLVLALVLSILMADTITKPLLVLKESMKEVEKGNFSNVNLPITKNNEIGSLANSFQVMIEEIQNLMKQNIYEQRQKRRSELKALQSQINPHFLYNTLDSIIWMAEGGNTEDVVIMTSSLAKLMRQGIGNNAEIVSIEREIDYVRSYLTIQKMRYKDKLEFEIDLESEIYYEEIIKLVLQPIVENAIYHGIKCKESAGGIIHITGYAKREQIVITISDNGAGMSEETLRHIFDEHKVNYKSNGVGVYNIQQRLHLYYGKEYGISYISELGKGTTARVVIPRKQVNSNEKLE